MSPLARRRAEAQRVERFVSAIRATARPLPALPVRWTPQPVDDTAELELADLLLGPR